MVTLTALIFTTFNLDDQPVKRIVLGDWYEHGSVLTLKAGEFELANIDSTQPQKIIIYIALILG